MMKASYLDNAKIMDQDVSTELKGLGFDDPLFVVAFRESKTAGKEMDAVLLVKKGKTLKRTDLRNKTVSDGDVLRPTRDSKVDEVLQINSFDGTAFICIPITGLWLWI